MIKRLILPLLALSVSFAQPPGAGARQRGTPPLTEIKAYLSLSDTQVSSIMTSNKAAREANRPIAEQMRSKSKALKDAMAAGNNDANAVGAAMLEIQALRKQMEANHTKAHDQALSFLSAEQKAKLDTLAASKDLRREAREAQMLNLLDGPPAGRRPHGRSGPGGPAANGFRNFRR